ncbi:Sulfotransferase domain-containing protein [Octadecabacter temperatus]|uniref:Sulfotransferase domain protein n=1 Tax=Octadecabacter temperatus TaxID=1458307 RepID=A0A0K0YAC1_9RHOB|nr:sulfotransferase domain-containing protein [Octadecabacter temperatus]AKS47842.1 Sulfotransferase domain protein [Octadecabacter temperatus]SIO48292.1 Sulfotransferase domain-containing protein [Octadecabacter temperatus]
MNDTNQFELTVGLYSFPKSGNTWLRAIIAGITEMPQGPGILQRFVTDTHYGKVKEDPWYFQGKDWYFYKSHWKDEMTEDGGGKFATDKIIYIYRHPLDVFLSYLNFVSRNVAANAGKNLPIQFDSVEDLKPEEMEQLFQIFLEHQTLFPQNRKFGGLFEHIDLAKEREAAGESIKIIRYEDLQDNFTSTVEDICSFLGMEGIQVEKVFEKADQRTQQNGKFFWKRQKNNYLNYLTKDQLDRFYEAHGEKMTSYGYPRED